MGDSALVSNVLYKKLLSVESSPPILHRQWSQVIGPRFSLDGHWSLVRDSFTENFINDVIWFVESRCAILSLTGGAISSSQCASCPLRETIYHCFLNCRRVKRVWLHFAPLFSFAGLLLVLRRPALHATW